MYMYSSDLNCYILGSEHAEKKATATTNPGQEGIKSSKFTGSLTQNTASRNNQDGINNNNNNNNY